jgi:hypothetical protein
MEAVPLNPTREFVDLGLTNVSANYEDGYIHVHITQHTGGRGMASMYLKLRPFQAHKVADMLRRAALADDEGRA